MAVVCASLLITLTGCSGGARAGRGEVVLLIESNPANWIRDLLPMGNRSIWTD